MDGRDGSLGISELPENILLYLVLRPRRRAQRQVLAVTDGRPAPVLPLRFGSRLLVLNVGGLQRPGPALRPARLGQGAPRPLAPLPVGLVQLAAGLQGHHHWACRSDGRTLEGFGCFSPLTWPAVSGEGQTEKTD